MKSIITVLLLMFLFFSFGYAQTKLYMPLEYQYAYYNGTRSMDGNPGKNYWQNYAKYDIDVTVIPGSWKIQGSSTITYTNNSPDSLGHIFLKAYPNHYKRGAARDSEVRLTNLTEGMVISDISINDDSLDLSNPKVFSSNSTILRIALNEKMSPGETLILKMQWNTELPLIYKNRIGAYDSTSAFMGYWYPQISVYDDIDGWDTNQYLGTQEFYRDYADFDVRISVPGDYKVWATGELINMQEVLDAETLKKLAASKDSPQTIKIDPKILDHESIIKTKTWHYVTKNVLDFAAGISNKFTRTVSEVNLNGKKVQSNVVFDEKDSSLSKNIISSQNKALEYFSDQIPGITYPYSQFTTFVGVPEYDGMEFPMMANNGSFHPDTSRHTKASIDGNISVTVHEFAHTYFPYYTGINEVKSSWMEEGMAVYLTSKYIEDIEHNSVFGENYFKRLNSLMGRQWESPLFSPSNHLVYRYMHSHLSYIKPAIMYHVLEDMLGTEVFLDCVQSFAKRWAGKHPTPYDFMFTFNNVSRQNLNWFWNAWVFEYGYADLGITGTKGNKLLIQRNGRLPVPIYIKVIYQNGKEKIIHSTAKVWEDQTDQVLLKVPDMKKAKSAEILTTKTPDAISNNNKFAFDK